MTEQPKNDETVTVETTVDTGKVKQILKVVGIGAAIGTVAYLLGGQRALYQVTRNQQDTIDILMDRTDEEEEPLELTE